MRKVILSLASVLSVLLLVLGLWGFLDKQSETECTFPSYTLVNGVDCSGLTVAQADHLLTSTWNSKIYFIKADGDYIGSLGNIRFDYDIADRLRGMQRHGSLSPILTWLMKRYGSMHVTMSIGKINDSFVEQFQQLRLLQQTNYIETKNAYIDMSSPTLMIVKEVYGNQIDSEKLFEKIVSDIEQGVFVLNAAKEDYYKKPTIFSDDPQLLADQAHYRKYLDFQVLYDFGDRKEKVTPEILSGLMSYKDGQVTVHEEKVAEYVSGLAKKYDTIGSTRLFESADGTMVSVKGGTYGFRLDQDSETKWLVSALQNGETQVRNPEYKQVGRSRTQNDIGSSYVEIDISAQHLWIYKDGIVKLSTDVVTGNVWRGKNTPTGTYYIFSKQRDRILRGPDYDGTEYASPVAYWMPFNGGVGLHDAPWRKAFGDDIYLVYGSHGCVNMPPWAAKSAFHLVDIGFPVVVHH